MSERKNFNNPLDWLKVLITLWIFVSTFFFPISNGQAFVRFTGVILFLIAFWSLAVPDSRASRILYLVFSVSLGLSPFLYGYKAAAAVNVYIAAAVSLCLSVLRLIQANKESR